MVAVEVEASVTVDEGEREEPDHERRERAFEDKAKRGLNIKTWGPASRTHGRRISRLQDPGPRLVRGCGIRWGRGRGREMRASGSGSRPQGYFFLPGV